MSPFRETLRRFGADFSGAVAEVYTCSVFRFSHEIGLLAVNLALLASISLVVLTNHSDMLLGDLGGAYVLEYVKAQREWLPLGPHLGINPLQGVGNVTFPENTGVLLAFLLQNFIPGGEVSKVFTFVSFAVECFLGTYVAFRLLGAGQLPSLAACWGFALFAFPFFRPAPIIPLFGGMPQLATLVMGAVLAVGIFHRIGKGSATGSTLLAALLLFVAAYLMTAFPVHVMLLVPAALYALGCIALSHAPRELFLKLAAGAAVILGLYLGGFVENVFGLLLYSAPPLFGGEMLYPFTTLYSASTLFQGPQHAFAPYLFALNLGGATIVGITMRSDAGRFAWVHLCITLLCLGAGFLLSQSVESYRGPMIVYFEIFLWPFYFLYSAILILSLAPVAIRSGKRALAIRVIGNGPEDRWATVQTGALGLAVMGLPWIAVPLSSASETPNWYSYPPHRTAIVDALSAELAISPGKPFKGSVATFTGTNGKEAGIAWYDQAAYDYALTLAVGNDHRFVGLWHYGVPTLQEYNHLVTPRMYLLASRLLARPQDRQVRTTMVLTRVNEGLLRSLGVRFLITDYDLGKSFRLHEKIEWDREMGRSLYLYELSRPNLGDFSPTEPIEVPDASEALARLLRGIDFARQILVETPLPQGIVPLTNAEMVFEKGRIRIRASSPGLSVALLPIQFSNCLRMLSPRGAAEPRLVRANVIQTAIVFDRDLDAELTMDVGPLGASTCRLRDYWEAKSFGIAEAAQAYPLDAVE